MAAHNLQLFVVRLLIPSLIPPVLSVSALVDKGTKGDVSLRARDVT